MTAMHRHTKPVRTTARETARRIRASRYFFSTAWLLLSVLLVSCAAKQTPPPKAPPHAAHAWQRFAELARKAETESKPFRVSATLRYTGKKGQGTRLSALLWGNGNPASPYPLRLELLTGFGSAAAKIREDEQLFLAYSPDEKTAYTHARGRRTLLAFGVPIPLSLNDLTLLVTGLPGRVFLPDGVVSPAMPSENGHSEHGILYALNGVALPGYLELSLDGTPLSWHQKPAGGWQMLFEPEELTPLQPRRIKVSHPEGYSALIVVREREFPATPFTSAQMDLILPVDTVSKTLKP